MSNSKTNKRTPLRDSSLLVFKTTEAPADKYRDVVQYLLTLIEMDEQYKKWKKEHINQELEDESPTPSENNIKQI